MKFEKIIPTDSLKPYIKHFMVSENDIKGSYQVFPSTGLVIGFQYRGQLATLKNETETNLSKVGITGISDSFKIFKNSINVGTILVYFTQTGLARLTSTPANELFNESMSLENIFDKNKVGQNR